MEEKKIIDSDAFKRFDRLDYVCVNAAHTVFHFNKMNKNV